MAEVRRILCPIDFSETSRAALRWAVELARRFSAELTLLHVYQAPTLSMPDGMVVGGPDVLTDIAHQVDESLRAWRDEAEALGATGVSIDSTLGATYPEITRYAADRAVDLIVIGTHGRTGLAHALLGSTAEKVVRHAACPVVTVRAP